MANTFDYFGIRETLLSDRYDDLFFSVNVLSSRTGTKHLGDDGNFFVNGEQPWYRERCRLDDYRKSGHKVLEVVGDPHEFVRAVPVGWFEDET